MAPPDPLAVIRHARRLVARYDADQLALLVEDPVAQVQHIDGLTVRFRRTAGCDLDASYDATAGTITIDPDASPSRARFSCLHELGHHTSDRDDEVNDWLYRLGDHADKVVEQLCDAFAAEILLPAEYVAEALRPGFSARHVARLANEATASREACVVRAAQQLREPGMVVLADPDGMVRFSSARSLPMRIGRSVRQPADSLIARAGQASRAATSHPETVTLRGRKRSYTEFHGTAHLTDDGYVFAVLRAVDDDHDARGVTFTPARAWICSGCGEDISDEDWCSTCSGRRCQTCGCRCGPPKPVKKPRVCPDCGLQIPLAHDTCPNHD